MRSPTAARQLSIHHAWLLDDPRQAPAGVDDTRSDDRAGRTGIDASSARSAAIGLRRGSSRQGGSGDHATEYEPTAGAGQQDVGVLAEPADAGLVGNLAIDDRVVVGERHRPPAVAAQLTGHCTQTDAQRRVVIGPRVTGHTPLSASGRVGLLGVVRPRADEHRAGTGDRPARIGRPLRVLVRELQPIVQAGILAPDQFGPCTLRGSRRRRHRRERCRAAAAISTSCCRYAASTEGGDGVGLTVTQRRHHSGANEQTHHAHFFVVERDGLEALRARARGSRCSRRTSPLLACNMCRTR